MTNVLINSKFQITQPHLKGGKDLIYVGRNIKSNELVSIQLEPVKELSSQLQAEAKILQKFKNEGTSFI